MIKENYKVDQVYHSNWSDELTPGHEDYWWKIDKIAEWIGYALEGSIHRAQAKPCFMSTIAVTQTKEKFGGCRIYCHLALSAKVEKQYEEECKNIKEKNNKYIQWQDRDKDCKENISKWQLEEYNTEKYPIKYPHFKVFAEKCLLRDAKWYRHVYQSAVKLWPQYEKAITIASDYFEYLIETEEELDKHFGWRIAGVKSYKSDKLSYKSDKLKNRLKELEEEKEFVKLICDFKKE